MKVPVIIFLTPYPYIFLIAACAAVYWLRTRYFEDIALEPKLYIPLLIFIYGGYHFTGHIFQAPQYLCMWAPVMILPAVWLVHCVRTMKAEIEKELKEEPIRRAQEEQDKVNAVMSATGLDREEARELLERYDGDDTRILMTYGSSKPKEQAPPGEAVPRAAEDGTKEEKSSAPGEALPQACPSCFRPLSKNLMKCPYCGHRLFSQVTCPACKCKNPDYLDRCQYCKEALK